jgi:hypothetical protein
MSVDGNKTSSTSQTFVLTTRNMEMSSRVPVLLGKTKINDVDLVPTLANAHEEVIGFDIAVEERLGVDVLDPGQVLVGQNKYGL